MNDERHTARVAGLWYLGLAVTGIVGFMLIRPALYTEGDPASALAHLGDRAALARFGVTVEIAIAGTQALTAVWFHKLFRPVNVIAAWAVAAFGIANALMILVSAGLMATATAVADDVGLAPGGDAAATVQLLFRLSSDMWAVGALFFGLWLIPMGHAATQSGRMPRLLGPLLIAGGAGYVLSAFVDNGVVDRPDWLVDVLTLPATVGELWMVFTLVVVGLRPVAASIPHATPAGGASAR